MDRSPEARVWTSPAPRTMDGAILWTLVYADIFDYPLTAGEVHRYLVGQEASLSQVEDLLHNGGLPEHVSRRGDYFTLSGREDVVETRRRREDVAEALWPEAIRFGRTMGSLPFVQMVAVTGALSVDNARLEDDIDYLIVTAADRLWLCRAMIIQFVVKPAARRGIEVCPNYVLSERALTQFSQNLFTAHEIVQMVPIAGAQTYERLCRLNRWVGEYLPNAYGRPRRVGNDGGAPDGGAASRVTETALGSAAGGRLERWEMTRKVRRFEARNQDGGDASFSADWCKGHFDSHGKQVREAFSGRLASLFGREAMEAL